MAQRVQVNARSHAEKYNEECFVAIVHTDTRLEPIVTYVCPYIQRTR